MNLDEALAKHAEWKVKFRSAISMKEKLDASTINADDQCELGKWLHGAGQASHGADDSFSTLRSRHAEFHRAAGKIAQRINSGEYDMAEKMLASNSEYGAASSAVGGAIIRFKKKIG